MPRPSQNARAGFSLIELMIALVIIGVMAMAVAPSLSEVLADNRQVASVQAIVRFARHARSLTTSSGVAHLVVFKNSTNAAGSYGLGVFELYGGMNVHCAQTPWDQAFSTTAGSGQGPIEVLNMYEFNPNDAFLSGNGTWTGSPPTASDTSRQVIKITAVSPATTALPAGTVMICYQPNGETFTSTDGQWTSLAPQQQDIQLTISRSVNAVQHGQNRAVLFRSGATARVQ